MSRSPLFLLLAFVIAVAPARADPPDITPPAADADAATWVAFSDNLVKALQTTDNLGLQCSALQHVAAYGDRVDVDAAKFDIVRLYRDHSDSRVRMAALAGLAQMSDGWVADFLLRSARFEKDEHLARLTLHAAQAVAARRG